MNKRYWFVVADYNTATQTGKLNLGIVSDAETPFSNEFIKNQIVKNNDGLEITQLVVINFFEFKSEADYWNFWAK